MKVYADTNFFTALYCPGPNEAEAQRLHAQWEQRGTMGYPITMIGRMEFINALQQAVFFTLQGVPGIQINREYAMAVEALYLENLAEGKTFRTAVVSERLLEQQFQNLVHRHTAKHGFRAYDILHVSTALALGCDTFWSFDDKARKLAKLEGLRVN